MAYHTTLAAQKETLMARFLNDDDAEAMLSAHAELIDRCLSECYDKAGGGKRAPLAVIAVGGYGRRELYPYSDIDILFLHDGAHEKDTAPLVERVLHRLWDIGLKVGHAHRSAQETTALAQVDLSVETSLIDARFVVGHKPLFTRLKMRLTRAIGHDAATRFIEAKLAERDVRHRKFGDSRYMLEPQVKEGKGGLRDVHTLWWLARTAYPIRSLKELVSMRHLTIAEYERYDEAKRFLQRVRIHLHRLTGRAEDRLSFDHQRAVAEAMGFRHADANLAITRFMRRYFVAVRTVGAVTRVLCALFEDEKKRAPRQPLYWLTHTPEMLSGFSLEGGRLNVNTPTQFATHPVLMLELFYVAQQHGLDIHPRALQLVARNLPRIDRALQHDARANAIFLNILTSDKGPETTLRRMSEAGVLGKFIPDFGRVIGMMQFNRYHIYTVDEHTLVALGILHAIEKGALREETPLASDIIHRVRMKRVLYLAVFCHDIAKGRGGDHSEIGERIVRRLAMRMGFAADEVETAGWLVRHHLLFSNTVFKRDVVDPKTVSDFVAEVQTAERLKLLLVLTVADMRAVAPGVWNHWKAALMRDLYRRADQAMGTGDPAGQTAYDEARHAQVERLIEKLDACAPFVMDATHHAKERVSDLTIVARDQPGLFSLIAGAVSLAGANVVGAKIFTLKNGVAVEMFRVQDRAGEMFDQPERLDAMQRFIAQAISGELDLKSVFAKRKRAHIGDTAPQVLIDNEASHEHTVIEINCRDRPGLLYDATRTIAGLGLGIATAHISTYGVQVADVFYVKDAFGMKLTHAAKLAAVREALLTALCAQMES